MSGKIPRYGLCGCGRTVALMRSGVTFPHRTERNGDGCPGSHQLPLRAVERPTNHKRYHIPNRLWFEDFLGEPRL